MNYLYFNQKRQQRPNPRISRLLYYATLAYMRRSGLSPIKFDPPEPTPEIHELVREINGYGLLTTICKSEDHPTLTGYVHPIQLENLMTIPYLAIKILIEDAEFYVLDDLSDELAPSNRLSLVTITVRPEYSGIDPLDFWKDIRDIVKTTDIFKGLDITAFITPRAKL